MAESAVPALAQKAVLVRSEQMPEGSVTVRGYNFDDSRARGEVDYHALLQSYRTSGFQAMNFGLAVEQISQMVYIVTLNIEKIFIEQLRNNCEVLMK